MPPWEKYGSNQPSGPWAKYGAPPPSAPESPGFLSNLVSAGINQSVPGMDITPEEVSHAGSALGSDLWNMVQGAPRMAVDSAFPGVRTGMERGQQGAEVAATGNANVIPEIQHYGEQKAAGYNPAYRVISPVAENLGVNVRGMEQAAKEGDSGSILGHAATVPVIMAATEGAARGLPVAGEAVSTALEHPTAVKLGQTANLGLRIAGKTAEELPVVGGFVKAGKAIGGLRELPEIWHPSQGSLDFRAKPIVGNVASEVFPEASPAVQVPAVDTSPKAVGNALNESLGGWEGPKPGISMREQFNPQAVAVEPQQLPSGFAQAESSAVKGYKYSPEAREFEVVTNDGSHHVYGDVSPEQAQAFETNPSKGKAWADLRNSSSAKVAKVVSGQRVPVKPPKELRSASPLERTMQDELKSDPFSKSNIKAENDWYQQAKAELGEGAGVSKIAQRAQELKLQSRKPPVSEDLTDILTESLNRVRKQKGKL